MKYIIGIDFGTASVRVQRSRLSPDGTPDRASQAAQLKGAQHNALPAVLELSTEIHNPSRREVISYGHPALHSLLLGSKSNYFVQEFKPCLGRRSEDVAAQGKPVTAQVRRCPQCSALCSPTAIFCSQCGTSLKSLAEEGTDALFVYSVDEAFGYADLFLQRIAEDLRSRIYGEDLTTAQGYAINVGVPVHWREATRERFQAMLAQAFASDSVTLTPEPEAALAYHLREGDLPPLSAQGYVLVVDFGAGTTDIVLCRPNADGRTLAEARSYGERYGGSDFDVVLATHIARQLNIPLDVAIPPPLKQKAREFKEDFSTAVAMSPADPALEFETFLGLRIETAIYNDTVRIDRAEFESPAVAGKLIAEFQQMVERSLNHFRVTAPQVEAVIITGGGAAWYFVESTMRELFPRSRVVIGSEPGLAISRGLALTTGQSANTPVPLIPEKFKTLKIEQAEQPAKREPVETITPLSSTEQSSRENNSASQPPSQGNSSWRTSAGSPVGEQIKTRVAEVYEVDRADVTLQTRFFDLHESVIRLKLLNKVIENDFGISLENTPLPLFATIESLIRLVEGTIPATHSSAASPGNAYSKGSRQDRHNTGTVGEVVRVESTRRPKKRSIAPKILASKTRELQQFLGTIAHVTMVGFTPAWERTVSRLLSEGADPNIVVPVIMTNTDSGESVQFNLPLLFVVVTAYAEEHRLDYLLDLLMSMAVDPNQKDISLGTPLNAALSSGNAYAIDILLRSGASVIVNTEDGGRALECLVEWASCDPSDENAEPLNLDFCYQMVVALLKVGTDVNTVSYYGDTPLHVITSFRRRGNAELIAICKIIEELLKAGADPNVYGGLCPATPLHNVIGSVEYLITEAHEDLTIKEFDALCDMINLLLRSGAKINVPDSDGRAPLQCAESLVQLLSHHHSRRTAQINGARSMLDAMRSTLPATQVSKATKPTVRQDKAAVVKPSTSTSSGKMVPAAVQAKQSTARPPLSSSKTDELRRFLGTVKCYDGIHKTEKWNDTVVRLLLEGADPNIMVETRERLDSNVEICPLLMVVLHLMRVNEWYSGTAKLLLSLGANPNAVQEAGYTSLHVAALRIDVRAVEILLDGKADPNRRTNRNMDTPLHLVLVGRWGTDYNDPDSVIRIVQRLLLAGADVNARDRDGRTPLTAGGEEPRTPLFEILRAAGARYRHEL